VTGPLVGPLTQELTEHHDAFVGWMVDEWREMARDRFLSAMRQRRIWRERALFSWSLCVVKGLWAEEALRRREMGT